MTKKTRPRAALAVLAAALLPLASLTLTAPASAQSAVDTGPPPGEYAVLDPGAPFEIREYVRLDVTDGRLGFTATCNQLSGQADWSGDVLALTDVVGTLIGCDPDAAEEDAWLTTFLTGKPSYVLDGDGFMLTREGITLVAVPAAILDAIRGSGLKAPLKGTHWGLRAIETRSQGSQDSKGGTGTVSVVRVRPGTGAWLQIKGRKLALNTGCNQGGGQVAINGKTLTASDVWTTRIGCQGKRGRVEQQVITALAGPLTWRTTGTTLTLARKGVTLTWVMLSD